MEEGAKEGRGVGGVQMAESMEEVTVFHEHMGKFFCSGGASPLIGGDLPTALHHFL